MGLLARSFGTHAARSVALFSVGLAIVVAPTVAYLNRDALGRYLPGISAIAATDADPRLVTFGPMALVNEGDHDFRQVVRISVPEGAGRLHVRLFDPDTGGGIRRTEGAASTPRHGPACSATAPPRPQIFRDERGVVQESVEGDALASASFRSDPALDGRWTTLGSTDASAGMAASGGRRESASGRGPCRQ